MIKVALLVIVTSSINFKEMPNVSVTGFYKDIKSCYKVMDNIRESLNTEEILEKLIKRDICTGLVKSR